MYAENVIAVNGDARFKALSYNQSKGGFSCPTTRLQASSETSIYRWVMAIDECLANAWTSRREPPTDEIFRAHVVMAVRRPECDEQPS